MSDSVKSIENSETKEDEKEVDVREELANFIFTSKYARYNEKLKRRETWNEAVSRVENMHMKKFKKLDSKDLLEIEKAFDLVREKKVIPSMRSLQFGGIAVEKKNQRMFNCCVRHIDSLRAFAESFHCLLCGNGVGFGITNKYLDRLPNLVSEEDKTGTVLSYVVEDTIEGWSDSIQALLECYFKNTPYTGRKIVFDFSKIRKKGSLLKTGGGKAPGYKGLKNSLIKIKELLDSIIEEKKQSRIKTIDVYDILMHCADAVLSGGVRRSACSVVFDKNDEDMMNAKTFFKVEKKHKFGYDDDINKHIGDIKVNGKKYHVELDDYDYKVLQDENKISWFHIEPQRARSNNSAMFLRNTTTFENFQNIIKKTREFGEPGFVFADDEDTLFNPCYEIGFIPITKDGQCGTQFCNLSSINGAKIKTKEDYLESVKAATIIGTCQASYNTFDYLGRIAEKLTREESLLGVSMTGIMDSPEILLNSEFQKEAALYAVEINKEWSKKLGINPAARVTCVKPEGCQVKDTIISTSEGLLELSEIGNINGETWQKKNLVVSTDTGCENSSNFFVNGLKETKIIKMRSGIDLEATLNHKYKIWRGKPIWVETKDLVIGDKILYRVGHYNGGSYQTLQPNNYVLKCNTSNVFTIDNPKILDEELAWLIGLYIGDGSNHKKGIRISGDYRYREELDKAALIIKNKFGINRYTTNSYKHKNINDNRLQYCFNSQQLLNFLNINGLSKNKSLRIEVPLIIRKSPKSVISAFIDGYAAADGCDIGVTRSFCTSSKKMAKQIGTILRAIGKDCKVREYAPSKGSFGKTNKYWIQERKGRNGKLKKNRYIDFNILKELESMGMADIYYDDITDLIDSKNETFDIEVPNGHTYLANGFVSHNTGSLILCSGSGIHANHSRNHIRRVQCNKIDNIYKHFKKHNPQVCEHGIWSAAKSDDCVSFPITIPDNSIIKEDITAIKHLDIIKSTQQNWVLNGTSETNTKNVTHNVSCTVLVKETEWNDVIKYLYDNRKYFAAVSLLPDYGDKLYKQAPYEKMTTPDELAKFKEMKKSFKHVDYTKMTENEDETFLQGELVCSGNSCEITRI